MHLRWNRNSQQGKHGWSDIENIDIAAAGLSSQPRRDQVVVAVLGVIRLIGPGVIFVGVNPIVAESTHSAPDEVAEDNDQIWRDTLHLAVNLVWYKRLGWHWPA